MKTCAVVALILATILIGVAFISGLEFDWGIMSLVSGAAMLLNSIALLQVDTNLKK